jgi:hypothetical protein
VDGFIELQKMLMVKSQKEIRIHELWQARLLPATHERQGIEEVRYSV